MSQSLHDPLRRKLIGAAAATFLLTVSGAGLAAGSQVVAVRVWPSSTYTRLTIEASSEIRYKHFSLANPNRLVIDLEDVQLTGVLQDVAALAAQVKARGGWMHCDAVQALGKVKVDFRALGVHGLTVSAHKIQGPLGAGAHSVDERVDLTSIPARAALLAAVLHEV